MNVDLGLWGKLTRVIVVLLLAAVGLGVAVWYLPLIRQNEAMRKEILQLRQQVQKEEDAVRQLKASLDALRDPRTVERLARERLGYAKPGETVVRFDPPQTNAVPSKP